MRVMSWAAPAAILLLMASAAQAATPAQTCESGKNKEAGKYASCRHKAEARFAVTGDGAWRTARLQKCADAYGLKWAKREDNAGGACPSTGDLGPIRTFIDAHTDGVAGALAGGALPDCPIDLATCQSDLAACTGGAPQGQLRETGQVLCWDTAGAAIACAGTGQDGELLKGLARAYVDNGDGTITDTRTGLMWEKQSDDGSLNDKDNVYTWADAFAEKIAGLNAGGGFAGYTDWRLPNRGELESLVDLSADDPSVSPAFNTSCTVGCTVAACSCTRRLNYWSSSTYANQLSGAWTVHFLDGGVHPSAKVHGRAARGVRGGS